MRGLWLCLLAAGCGGDDHTTTIKCSGGASGALPLQVTGGDDLGGAGLALEAHTTDPGSASIACHDDIVPDGFTALGPAVTFGAEGTWSDRPFAFTVPYKAARLPTGAGRRHVRIVASRFGGAPFFPAITNREIDDTDAYASTVSFHAGELTTYQAVVETTAGQSEPQQFGWNAIVGISMGGNAAMTLAMKHPERFDAFADLGGEPGPSMRYTLGMVRDFVFGGFCDAASGKLGQLCPVTSTKVADQFEAPSDYDHMLYQPGDGVGLTLQRSLYMKGVRDMARSMGNPALYNPDNSYTPPGVPLSFIAQDATTRCANPIVLHDYFDREFNPAGDKPVITYCDGGDTQALGYGVWNQAGVHNNPSELLLAVDLNGNGQRDAGEPIITNAYEPYQDVGIDGLADKDEPGYDPVTNPDPDHDDYHWQRNPNGTENNNAYDKGEPYEDVGIDGVAHTCQAGATPPTGVSGCYDYGEGDGKWTQSPSVDAWYAHDAPLQVAALSAPQRKHMRMWFDAGIRDFLNNSVSTNATIGAISGASGVSMGMYEGFAPLENAPSEAAFDFTTVKWDDLPQNNYVRYGNPDASEAGIMSGDGRHVGTATQLVNRATSAFAWLNHVLPNGDLTDTFASGQIINDLTFTSPSTGRVSPFGLFLPPGYDDPANAGARYPVVYFLHGYGQQPADLVALSAVFGTYMNADQPVDYRFQKFIIVYVDGRCRPGSDSVPVDPTGDQCEQGTFYLNAPLGGQAQVEDILLELMDHIDTTYRTKKPSTETVTP